MDILGLAFFVAFAALADFGVALERGFAAFEACTFFGFAAEASAVAELLTLAGVATFFAGLNQQILIEVVFSLLMHEHQLNLLLLLLFSLVCSFFSSLLLIRSWQLI